MGTLRQPGDPGPPPGRIVGGEIGAIHQHPALRRDERPTQQCQQRALPRAARPDQCDDLTATDGQVDALRMAQLHPVQPQCVELNRNGNDICGHDVSGYGVDHIEGGAGRGQAGYGRVILRADLAQRQVHLRGEQQREQPAAQVQRARHQPKSDRHRNQRHRQGRQQFQHERRHERPAQRHHGLFPVGIGDPADHLHLGLRPIEDLQRRQTLDDVEEVPGQPAEHRPLLVGPGPGGEPHQHHEDRNQWQGDREHDRGREVRTGDTDEQERRDDHHHDQGR